MIIQIAQFIKRERKGCAGNSLACSAVTSGKTSSHLPGLDFVLVVVLKDAFIAQTQPPRDPLLVLKHKAKDRLKKRLRERVKLTKRKTKYICISKCQSGLTRTENVFCVCVCEKTKGRVVKLYLYSVVMYSICGQRLYNAHITVRSRKTDVKG